MPEVLRKRRVDKYRNKTQNEYFKFNLCLWCGKKNNSDKGLLCVDCYEKNRAYRNKRKKKYLEEGLCLCCREKVEEGFKVCVKCREISRNRMLEKRKNVNLCSSCLHENDNKDFKTCSKCREKNAKRMKLDRLKKLKEKIDSIVNLEDDGKISPN